MKKRIFLKTVILVLIIGMPFIVNSSDKLILIPAKKGTTWGYVSPNSEKKIPFIYDVARVFSEGLATVKKEGKCGYIDKSEKVVIPLKYDDLEDFSEGLAAVLKRKRRQRGLVLNFEFPKRS
jgi:S-adenosylmethionine synthetase